MRFTWLVVPAAGAVSILSLAGFSACSSNSPATDGTGSGSDAARPETSANIPGTDSGVGPGTDAAGTDPAPPTDSGVAPTSCTSPASCASSDVCCGTIPVTGGTIPNCTTGPISTVCKAPGSCMTSLGSSCSGTQTVRLCTKNSDCTETNDNLCCTFGDSDGGSLSFCANGLIGAFGGGKCM